MPSSGRRTAVVVVMSYGSSGALRHDHGLHAVAGSRVGERIADALERESRGDQALETELRHQRERALVRGAAAERAADPDLAEVNVPEVERQDTALGIHADELEKSVRPRERDRFADQIRLADGLAHHVGATPAGELHHAVTQVLARRVDHHGGAETLGHLAALLDRIGHHQTPGAEAAGQHHRDEPHDAAADDEHRRALRHRETLEARQAAGGGLCHRRGHRVEAARQRVDDARRQGDTLGKAADAHALRALAHAPRGAGRALAATVGWLAADGAPDEALGDAAPDLAHDAGVLVAEHERRLPRKQTLRGVDIGAADARGVTSTTTCPGPASGSGAVSIVKRLSPCQVATFISAPHRLGVASACREKGGITSVAISSIERRQSLGWSQSWPDIRSVPKGPISSRSATSWSTTRRGLPAMTSAHA